MEVRERPSADEVTRLRACVNDLASALASPTLWTDREPPPTVSTLLDTLRGVADASGQRRTTDRVPLSRFPFPALKKASAQHLR